MPKLKLTDLAVKRIKAEDKKQVDYWDTMLPSFGLRVSQAGRKTWVIMTRTWVNGKRKLSRVKIGTYPDTSLAQARKLAREAIQIADSGKRPDIVWQHQETAKADDSINTYAHVRDDFLQKYRIRRTNARPRPRTLDEMNRVLKSERMKHLEPVPLSDITRQDVRNILDQIMGEGYNALANRTHTYLNSLFNWAAERDLIDEIPTTGIKAPGEKKSRERVLSADEIVAIWKALTPSENIETSMFEQIVKILILTGQRRSEVGGMRWREIDFDKMMWTVPAIRTKNKRTHLVPLSPAVMEILSERKESSNSPLVFTTNGKTSFSGWSRSKQRTEKRADLNEHWILHDLRRTLVTHMNEELGIQPHVVEAVVNHASGIQSGVAGVYNRAQYLDERKAALNAWADYIEQIIKGADVIQIRPDEELVG